jgi:hypothetical protein
MAHAKRPTGGVVPNDIPEVAAVAVVVPASSDVESQFRQEHTTATEEFGDERAGMGMGIALFVLILVGLLGYIICYAIFLPSVGYAQNVDDDYYYYYPHDYYFSLNMGLLSTWLPLLAAVVIASILTCGCCCVREYKLKPHVKKWATATLVVLCLLLAFTAIRIFLYYGVFWSEPYAGLIIFCFIEIILLSLALVFSGIFTWGRNGCSPRTSA